MNQYLRTRRDDAEAFYSSSADWVHHKAVEASRPSRVLIQYEEFRERQLAVESRRVSAYSHTVNEGRLSYSSGHEAFHDTRSRLESVLASLKRQLAEYEARQNRYQKISSKLRICMEPDEDDVACAGNFQLHRQRPRPPRDRSPSE